jgi:phosphate starvation-inducible PhoH-like protein
MKKQKHTPKDIFSAIEPLTDTQALFLQSIKEHDMIIVDGCAGTGKTYLAASCASAMLKEKIVERIIITRPVIPTGRSLGYFPGDLLEKMQPWVAPFMEVMKVHFSKEEIEVKIKNGGIEIVPFEVMRGRSFDNSFVILDEAQNCSYHEMKMFLTRVGNYSKTIVIGDSQQSDMHWLDGAESGLDVAKRLATKIVNLPVIEFDSKDIVRSDLCKMWIEAFEQEGRKELPKFLTR